jgi:hypothetical protein
MKTRKEAEAVGMTVDTHCYPPFAYRGPRFNPASGMTILTDLEAELRDALQALVDRDVNSYTGALQLLSRLK